jgi:PAS domain S-box-containing protein
MKGNSLGNLRVRLVFLVLLAVIPSLGFILYTARVQRQLADGAAHENLSRIAILTAADASGVIEGAQQLLGGLAQSQQIRSSDPAACAAMMTKVRATYPFYSTLGVASAEGNVICSAPPVTGSPTEAKRGWFRQVVQTHDFAVGEYEAEPPAGPSTNSAIGFAYPINNDQGRIESVVFARLDLSRLNSLLVHVATPPAGASLVVVDRRGTILTCFPTANCQGQAAPESSLLLSAATHRGRGTAEITGSDGIERICAFTPVGRKRGIVDAYVSVSIPKAIALADANQQLVRNSLALALVGLIAVAAAWFGGHAFILGRANAELEQRVQQRTRELAQEQLLLRMLMDNIPDTIYFKDPQSRFTRINRAQAEVLGLRSPDQAVGKTDADFFTPEHAQAALADERRIAESGMGLISKRERVRRADGSFRWMTATKVPLRDPHGTITGLVGISRDVTEVVKVEHLLQSLVESLPELIFVKDTQGRYVIDNATHRDFLGLRTLEDIVGKTAADFYPRDLAERIDADDRAVLKAQTAVQDREEQFTNHRGEKIRVVTSKIPYRDEQGRVAGLICFSRIIGGRN